MNASDLISFNDEINESSGPPPYNRRPLVYIIAPDPFELKSNINTILLFGNRACADSGKKNESPLLCYALKLGLYGFNHWSVKPAPFSAQQLFDMQVSQMLKCKFVAVYGTEMTESMERLLAVARNKMPRIDFRNI